MAREVSLLARPGYRRVVVVNHPAQQVAERFLRHEVAYDEVLRHQGLVVETEHIVGDVGPHIFRYSDSDRLQTPRFWMDKLQREVSSFAHEVVRAAAKFPQLVIANPVLRANYAKLVEREVFRVIDGSSAPQPTNDLEPMRVDAGAQTTGMPELVAAELVRDVVDKNEFEEFRTFDRVTIRNGDKFYRIPRMTHGLIEVWDAKSLKGHCRLCVIFKDPGMPPSDEVVMKYLLAKHDPDTLWNVGIRFAPPAGKFDGAAPRRWTTP